MPERQPFTRGLRRAFRDLVAPARPGDGPVNHISLGTHCHMAQVLKTEGLRTWSGPFDWIFSTPGMVRDCLVDDYAALLRRADLETIPIPERPDPSLGRCRHRVFRERYGLPCVFNHHDPASSDADYAFLEAGVRRFRTAVDDPAARNHLWLMTEQALDPDIVRDMAETLATRKSRNTLIVIGVHPGRSEAREAGRVDGPGSRWLTVEVAAASKGLRFGSREDDRFLSSLVTREAAEI